MKKIIIAESMKPLLEQDSDFAKRTDVTMLVAGTNDDLLSIHQREKANLIIAQMNMQGTDSETVFAKIRNEASLRKVSLILACSGNRKEIERAERCHPNAMLTLPVESNQLLRKTKELLDIPQRESYRVLLSVNVEGNSRDRAFFCRSENISATGMLLETERVLAPGERIVCSFFLPESKQIVVTGEVVRKIEQAKKSEINHYGVRFEKVAEGTKKAIEHFISKKLHHPKQKF